MHVGRACQSPVTKGDGCGGKLDGLSASITAVGLSGKRDPIIAADWIRANPVACRDDARLRHNGCLQECSAAKFRHGLIEP